MNLIQGKKEVSPQDLDLSFRNLKIMEPHQVVSLSLSLQQYGQKMPLRVAGPSNKLVLLDGFKRQLAAAGMKWDSVEIEVIAPCVEEGVLRIIKDALSYKLHVLEESKFIKYLIEIEGYTVKQLGLTLGKSIGWVSNRKNFCDDVPAIILEKIFQGLLPPSSYVCVFKKFIQKLEVSYGDLESLIKVLSGKNLTIRELEVLSTAYFTYGEAIAKEILTGNIKKVLSLLMPNKKLPLTQAEQAFKTKLEHLVLQMESLLESYKKVNVQSELTPSFTASCLSLIDSFERISKAIYKQLEKLKRGLL